MQNVNDVSKKDSRNLLKKIRKNLYHNPIISIPLYFEKLNINGTSKYKAKVWNNRQ